MTSQEIMSISKKVISEIMKNPRAEQEQVDMASINALAIMYEEKSSDNLTKLRFITILVFLKKLLHVFVFTNLVKFARKNVKMLSYGQMKTRKTFW